MIRVHGICECHALSSSNQICFWCRQFWKSYHFQWGLNAVSVCWTAVSEWYSIWMVEVLSWLINWEPKFCHRSPWQYMTYYNLFINSILQLYTSVIVWLWNVKNVFVFTKCSLVTITSSKTELQGIASIFWLEYRSTLCSRLWWMVFSNSSSLVNVVFHVSEDYKCIVTIYICSPVMPVLTQ